MTQLCVSRCNIAFSRVTYQVYCEVSPVSSARHPPVAPLRSAPLHLGVTWSSRGRPDGSVHITVSISVPVSCRHRRHCRLLLRVWPDSTGRDTLEAGRLIFVISLGSSEACMHAHTELIYTQRSRFHRSTISWTFGYSGLKENEIKYC